MNELNFILFFFFLDADIAKDFLLNFADPNGEAKYMKTLVSFPYFLSNLPCTPEKKSTK